MMLKRVLLAVWFIVGKVLSSPYGFFMRLRRCAYKKGFLKSRSVDVPVICVGNLTMGGTGKTPMVAWLVKHLTAGGYKPVVLTRGYKAIGGKSDEAELLKRFSDANVVVNPDRYSGAQAAIKNGANVLIMDDGFQHLKLKRDLNIVLIDATNPFNWGVYLPIGKLREPISALQDAHIVIITRSNEVSSGNLQLLRDTISSRFAHLPIYTADHKPLRIIDEKGQQLSPQAINGKRVCAFCGIGNADSFFRLLDRLGARVSVKLRFRDHVHYNPAVLERISNASRSADAELLITTSKDRVKIEDVSSLPLPLWTLEVEIEFDQNDEERLLDDIFKLIKDKHPRQH
ncbi:MAG: tetraacyldisaccharide 4'-kinase [Planctomycetes bacterium]|nr:tetraacyldisaccharide 4'-kinase [Planctomycetota bacterium]